MIILIVLALAIPVGLFVARNTYSDGIQFCGFFLTILGAVGLFLGVLSLPISHYEYGAGIRKAEAVRSTITAARANGGNIENAAFQMKVAEVNQWIAAAQFYNRTPFGLWIPDAVDTLEPIR